MLKASGDVVGVAAPSGLTELDRLFELDDRLGIASYIERHPHVIDVLSEAYGALRRAYEPGDAFCLKVVRNRESSAEQLYVIVRTSLPSNDAYDRLDEFDTNWWLDALGSARGALTIDVEP